MKIGNPIRLYANWWVLSRQKCVERVAQLYGLWVSKTSASPNTEICNFLVFSEANVSVLEMALTILCCVQVACRTCFLFFLHFY